MVFLRSGEDSPVAAMLRGLYLQPGTRLGGERFLDACPVPLAFIKLAWKLHGRASTPGRGGSPRHRDRRLSRGSRARLQAKFGVPVPQQGRNSERDEESGCSINRVPACLPLSPALTAGAAGPLPRRRAGSLARLWSPPGSMA